ncbi:hypothetical protein MRB53_042342 [Persea americana]|nr:hypothetical protein MRB53_042342 [Persea americana]
MLMNRIRSLRKNSPQTSDVDSLEFTPSKQTMARLTHVVRAFVHMKSTQHERHPDIARAQFDTQCQSCNTSISIVLLVFGAIMRTIIPPDRERATESVIAQRTFSAVDAVKEREEIAIPFRINLADPRRLALQKHFFLDY